MIDLRAIADRVADLERRFARAWIRRPAGAAGSATALVITITQVAHGFAAGETIYHDGTEWVYPLLGKTARPVSENAAHLQVIEVIDADSFTAAPLGSITHPDLARPIIAIDPIADTLTITGDYTRFIVAADLIEIAGSTDAPDGTYTVASVALVSGDTQITVVGDLTGSTADGTVTIGRGTRYLQRSFPADGSTTTDTPSPSWPDIATGLAHLADRSIPIANHHPQALLAVDTYDTLTLRGSANLVVTREISGVPYYGGQGPKTWIFDEPGASNPPRLTVQTATTARTIYLYLDADALANTPQARFLLIQSDPFASTLETGIQFSLVFGSRLRLTAPSLVGDASGDNLTSQYDYDASALEWCVMTGENTVTSAPSPQQDVTDPGPISIPSATADLTWSPNERDQINNLKTAFTDLHTSLDELLTAVRRYGMVG